MDHRSQYFDPATRWVKAQSYGHAQHLYETAAHIPSESKDSDLPMDDFDRALLAEPPRSLHPIFPDVLPTVLNPQLPMFVLREDVSSGQAKNKEPQKAIGIHLSSSSPSMPVSSPTVIAMQNRQYSHNRLSTKPVNEVPLTPQRLPGTISLQYPTTVEQSQFPAHLAHAPPIVQGIQLIETSRLPDQHRALFKFPLFNAVQSKCFTHAYEGNDNIILAAPTGSGKTAVMELAICRLLIDRQHDDFKVVYQAPTKSLCSERYRDWSAKFGSLGLQCAELTGDSEPSHIKHAQQANVIIATPEKWDSVTRKWKDNAKLMRMIKLFLVDEVHILKETRGATLEAVVSRMKSVGSDVRFVALSATIPNPEDVATWLGLNHRAQHLPAIKEVFGESFRPTELEKHVIGYQSPPNDFILDNMLVKEVPAVIARYSKRKPVMIFCPTQKSAAKMARSLAELWLASSDQARLWAAPKAEIKVMNPDLRDLAATAVAFHHGGLDASDRQAVEAGFLNGNITILCSTSTLAVGVNLPCYLVILKGTSCYTESGLQEYSILETMQMLGRAGRPQFETSACAVIMTSKEKVPRYQSLIAGEDVLESSLHENLIEHLNAEIGIGTVSDIPTARQWLRSTFLYVRILRNPGYYQLGGQCRDEDDHGIVDDLCQKDLEKLEAAQLIETAQGYRCTDFGQAMAQYYVKFDSMKSIMTLPPKAKQSEILKALTEAVEFKELRWRNGEKGLYKKINKSTEVRYPVKVDIALPAHKASLIIQAALGGYMLDKNDAAKFNLQMQQDTRLVLLHANRLNRCIIDVQLSLKDATSAKHALELGRSLAAKVWDDTPMQLKQVEGIGDVTARKLASHGITSIEILSSTESHKLELVLGKNPPFGANLLSRVHRLPSLLVTVKQTGRKRIGSDGAEIQIRCQVGAINGKIAAYFNRKPIYICVLCETSYGKLIDFRRFSASRLTQSGEFTVTTQLERQVPKIMCHVMCDEIAGTHHYAELKPDVPPTWFTSTDKVCQGLPRVDRPLAGKSTSAEPSEEFDDLDFIDEDFLIAENKSSVHAKTITDIDDILAAQIYDYGSQRSPKHDADVLREEGEHRQWRKPRRLQNGNWTCQHACNEEQKPCKHLCCKHGVKKPKNRPSHELGTVSEPSSAPAKKPDHSQAKANDKKTAARGIDEILRSLPSKQYHEVRKMNPSGHVKADDVSRKKRKTKATEPCLDHFDISSDSFPDLHHVLGGSKVMTTIPFVNPSSEDTSTFDDDEFECFDLADCDWVTYDKNTDSNHLPAEEIDDQLFKNVRPLTVTTALHTQSSRGLNLDPPGQIVRSEPPCLSHAENDNENRDSNALPSRSLTEANSERDNCPPTCDDADRDVSTDDSPSGCQFHLSEPLTGQSSLLGSTARIDARHKNDEEDGDQKRKWAQLDPWLYEQFGSHVDII